MRGAWITAGYWLLKPSDSGTFSEGLLFGVFSSFPNTAQFRRLSARTAKAAEHLLF
jgi:hypothetical protein